LNEPVNIGQSAKDEFEQKGYIKIPDALSARQVSDLCSAIDSLTSRNPDKIHNVADIFGKHDAFLELLDLPTVLPTVTELLGTNIWVNHSHLNANPATAATDVSEFDNGYGWHRDGGAIHNDLPWPPPLLSIKIGFYLTDLTTPGSGQTFFIRDSHKTGEKTPAAQELPDTAFPMMVEAGTAVLFDRRLIHSIRSANYSGNKRRVIFTQYAFRWMAAVDAMNVSRVRKKCNPVQRQLLGLTTSVHAIDGAQGRSGLYYPTPSDVPLAHSGQVERRQPLRSIARRALRLFRGQ
jgi:ectoine hydroxylase-related dioxygenase (phytanoyl-CoA dioxygenase family)